MLSLLADWNLSAIIYRTFLTFARIADIFSVIDEAGLRLEHLTCLFIVWYCQQWVSLRCAFHCHLHRVVCATSQTPHLGCCFITRCGRIWPIILKRDGICRVAKCKSMEKHLLWLLQCHSHQLSRRRDTAHWLGNSRVRWERRRVLSCWLNYYSRCLSACLDYLRWVHLCDERVLENLRLLHFLQVLFGTVYRTLHRHQALDSSLKCLVSWYFHPASLIKSSVYSLSIILSEEIRLCGTCAQVSRLQCLHWICRLQLWLD